MLKLRPLKTVIGEICCKKLRVSQYLGLMLVRHRGRKHSGRDGVGDRGRGRLFTDNGLSNPKLCHVVG